MNKELEQAAERIATSLYSKPEDDSDWIDDRIEELKQLILTDPFIIDLVKEGERLDYVLKEFLFNELHQVHYFPMSGKTIGNGSNPRTAIDSAIEQGKKVGV